ncbi:MAG TPA: L,D-transpeptidase family protein [Steroidobacteraceae bacterium]|nr:L,D-transpeptidase family protein [Steroidobacteraceae bacterium]
MKIYPMYRLLLNVVSLFFFAALVTSVPVNATTYPLPNPEDSVIGEVQYVTSHYEDTLLAIGRKYGVGYEEMAAANPGIDPWLPGEGTRIVIPTQYVLPNVPRTGIVVNLPEHRIYYFPKPKKGEQATVQTFPVSIGRMNWKTPLGITRVVSKQENPAWYPPESVRREHAADGDPLPAVVPAGKDNPLGEFAMRLGIPGGSYLIHGTNKPEGIGMGDTHGCIRMYPEDIEFFFKEVTVGTPVLIINQPFKMGWSAGKLFMEIHKPLLDTEAEDDTDLTNLTRLVVSATSQRSADINWSEAERLFQIPSGIPAEVPLKAASEERNLSQD